MKKISIVELVVVVMMTALAVGMTACSFEDQASDNDNKKKHDDGKPDVGGTTTDAGAPAPKAVCEIKYVLPPTVMVQSANVRGLSGSELTSDGKIVGAYSVLGDCKVDSKVECKLDELTEGARVMDVNVEVVSGGQVLYACYSDGSNLLSFGDFTVTCGKRVYETVRVSNGVGGCNFRVTFYGEEPNAPDGGTATTDAGTTTDAGGTTTDAGTTIDAGTIDPGTQYVGNFVANCVPPAGFTSCRMYIGYGGYQSGAAVDKMDMSAASGKLIPANDLCHSWWSPNAVEFAMQATRSDGTSGWIRNPDGNIVLLDPRGTRVYLTQTPKAENVGVKAVDIRYCVNPAY